jgi:hypothetical protein
LCMLYIYVSRVITECRSPENWFAREEESYRVCREEIPQDQSDAQVCLVIM